MADEVYTGVENLEVLADAVNYNRFLIDQVIVAARDAKRAIDFGAGTGTFAVMMHERGLDVACVETDEELRGSLRDRGLRAESSLDVFAEASQPFVYSLNVLEHIEDDRASLASLFSRLEAGGRLFLYVPAFQVLYSSMDRKVGHHRRYRSRALADLCRSVGFEVERVEYADSLGFFASLLYKAVGNREGNLSTRGVRIYDRFVFPLSRLLDRIGVSQLFGKNVIIEARRP